MIGARIAVGIFAAALATAGFAEEPERFSNPTLGIAITKPPEWVVLSAEANAANNERVRLNDAEMQAALARYATVPLYAFSRYPEPFDDVNPSVKINVRPAGGMAGQSGVAVLTTILPSLERAFPDFEIVEPISETSVGGLPAGHALFKYTLRSTGAAYPAMSEMWIVPRGRNLVMVGAGLRQDEKTGSRADIREIVDSIEFTQVD